MALAAFAAAPDLREILKSLVPDILIAVHTTLSGLHHRSANDEVGDLCQQIIVLLMDNDFRRLRSFDYRSSRRTWLTAVVRNHVINHLRRQKPTVSLNDLRADAASYQAMQDQRLIAQEQRESLRAASTKLTKRELELFELCYVADLSTGEIAEKMGIKPQSVRRRKHALVKKLQGLLELPQA
jgi:RNA polymerase sigma factor (sigma-70 family)